MIGFIAHEYGYTLDYIATLTPFQFTFLVEWLGWFNKKLNRRVRRR